MKTIESFLPDNSRPKRKTVAIRLNEPARNAMAALIAHFEQQELTQSDVVESSLIKAAAELKLKY